MNTLVDARLERTNLTLGCKCLAVPVEWDMKYEAAMMCSILILWNERNLHKSLRICLLVVRHTLIII